MRILEATIQHFRSVEKAVIRLDERSTVLIGGNEQGKTSVLRGLQYLDRDTTLQKDDVTYRGGLRASQQSLADIPIVSAVFATPEGLRPSLANRETFRLCRYADGHYEIVDPPQGAPQNTDELRQDLEVQIEETFAGIDELTNYFYAQVEGLVSAGADSFEPQLPELSSHLEVIATFDGRSDGSGEELKTLIQQIRQLPDQPPEMSGLVDELLSQVAENQSRVQHLSDRLDLLSAPTLLEEIVAGLPRFVYFRTQDLLEDQVALSEINANPNAHPVLRSLLDLCRLDPTVLAQQDATSRAQATSSASTQISGEVNSFWKQATVGMHVSVDGPQLIVLIDEPNSAPLRPSQRSDGFQWFLSFYIALTSRTRGELRDAVLLLDDPGVYLHASGQRDLLATLERLSDSNQITLATHSPFLIDRQHLERVRIVEKSATTGTAVIEKFWNGNEDALAPIRASIGMSLGQSLFSGRFTVAVEGLSDLYLIEALSAVSGVNGGGTIDFEQVSVLPVGGSQARYMVPILAKEGDDYFVLLDSDSESEKTTKFLREEYGIADEHLATLRNAGITPFGAKDFEIEDAIDPADFVPAVNDTFGKLLGTEITAGELEANGVNTPRIVRRLEKAFRDRNAGSFDKIRAALAFREHVDSGKDLAPLTIDSAKKIVELVNGKVGSLRRRRPNLG